MNAKLTLKSSLLLAVIMTACGGGKTSTESKETTADAPVVVEEVTYAVDKGASEVAWSGEVAGVYGHNGVVGISEGTVTAKGDQVTGGKIVIDMTVIQPLDSASYTEEEGHTAADLVGHLSTGDFFLVEEYPTSSFVIKSHEGSTLVGDLTVRGITKEEKATVTSLEITPEGLVGSADLVFNRQDYDVKWVHFMKDMVLSDDIKIKLDIVAKP